MNNARDALPASAALPNLLSSPFAHRGLWAINGPPENSLAAFSSAVEEGYGVELDVRLSKDMAPMVFHDRHLARMASAAAELSERTAADLADLRLNGTREAIPTLAAALQVVGGRGPLLVELKTEAGGEGPLEERVAEALKDYSGPVAVIGFNPASHAWFREHTPKILRGLNLDVNHGEPLEEAALDRMIAQAAPDFLLPGVAGLDAPALRSLHARQFPLVVWTLRSPGGWASLSAQCATLIFEGWRP